MTGETIPDKITAKLNKGEPLTAEDGWELLREIEQYRDLVRAAKYQTIHVHVRAGKPHADDEAAIRVEVVASDQASERAVLRELRRQCIHFMRQAEKKIAAEA